MPTEYTPLLETKITLEELASLVNSSRQYIDSFNGAASIGVYALESTHIINGFRKAEKSVEPPTVETVLGSLDEATIWSAQVVLSASRANRTSSIRPNRRIADKILKA